MPEALSLPHRLPLSRQTHWLNGVTLLLSLSLTGHLPSPSLSTASLAGPRAKTTAAPSGSLPGELMVNPTGAAVYVLPLTVPPGTDGVEPELSLSYNSQRGNGLLGPGWALNGLSAITRCTATPAQDGYRAGVSLGAFREDRFCLDGQRLMAVTGAYGEDGTVYHTEKETWTRVVSRGRCGQGPCWFEATNKDGSALRFGTADAAILAAGRNDGTRMVWGLKRLTTTTGNYVETTYEQDSTAGEYRPTTIRYTGNDAAGLEPRREVRFLYTPRVDIVYSAAAGSPQRLGHLLSRIETWLHEGAGSRRISQYRLEYYYLQRSQRAVLDSVVQCGADGSCLPHTIFKWQSDLPGAPAPRIEGTNAALPLSPGLFHGSNVRRYVADFNGDGRSDIAGAFDGSRATPILFSNGDGTFTGTNHLLEAPFDWPEASWSDRQLGDFNGDGMADFAVLRPSKALPIYFSNGDGTFSGTHQSLPNDSDWFYNSQSIRLTGDFDGDGRTDFAISRPGFATIPVYLSNGDGSFRGSNHLLPGWLGWFNDAGGRHFTGDWNGDGMTDIAVSRTGYQTLPVYFSNGDGSFRVTDVPLTNPDWMNAPDSDRLAGDFNGDGMTDFAIAREGLPTTIPVYLSNGDGSFRLFERLQPGVTGQFSQSGTTRVVGDFDGDGLSDIALSRPGFTQMPVYYAKGDGGFTEATYALPMDPAWLSDDASHKLVGDWNGDGRTDFAASRPGFGSLPVYRLLHSSILVGEIWNGMGSTLAIEYAPLTDQWRHLWPQPFAYPLVRAVSPIPLVKRTVRHDGKGGAYAYRYGFFGGRHDWSGRGFLGFDSMSLREEASGRISTSHFYWQFPLNGSVADTVIWENGSVRVSDRIFEYAVRRPTPATWQVVSQVEKGSHYSGGTTDHTFYKEFEHDAYGNLTVVADLGDVADPGDDLTTCMRYHNDPALWRLGYLTERQESVTGNCRGALRTPESSWTPGDTLSWQRFSYDGAMNLGSEAGYDDRAGQWATWSYGYDAVGNRTTTTDPLENVSTAAYDATWRTFPERVESPPNQAGVRLTVLKTFEPGFGNLTAERDPAGVELTFGFDAFGRKTSESGPDANGTPVLLRTWAYLGFGSNSYVEERRRPTWEAGDPAAWPFERRYHDGMDRLVRIEETATNPEYPRRQDFAFDALGRPFKESLPYFDGESIGWTVTTYDAENRPIRVTAPDGTAETLSYDMKTRRVTRVEAAGTAEASTTVRRLDGRGRTVEKIQPDGGVVTYAYDRLGRLVRQVDGVGLVTTHTYDGLGHLVSSTEPDTGLTRFDYDRRGLPVLYTGARGETVAYTYDRLGRPLSEVATVPGGIAETTSFTYDEPAYQNGAGHLTSVSMPGATWHFGYDAYGEASGAEVATDGRRYLFSYSNDPQGRPRETVYPDGSRVYHRFARDGNLAEIRLREPGGDEQSLARFSAYTALGRAGRTEHGNGVVSQHAYYPVQVATGKLSAITVSGPEGSLLFERQYTWNARDRVAGTATTGPVAPGPQSFTYDAGRMGYLAGATGPYPAQGYVYDRAGSRIEANGVSSPLRGGTHQPAAETYDASGNLTGRSLPSGAWSYVYDAHGRLRTAFQGSTAVGRFTYDWNGERTTKIDGDGTATRYVAPGFTVVFRPGAGPLYTRTIDGPHGPLTAITRTGDGTGLSFAPGLYDETGLAGRLRRAGRTLAALSPAPAGWVRGVAAASALATLAVLLLVAGGRWTTAWSRCRLGPALLVPALAAAVLLTGPGLLEASLVPAGPQGAGIPDLGTVYFHQDLLGSTVLATGAAGERVADLSYLPYGALDAAASTGGDRFRPKFSGKELDSWTGFYYFGARYYDPATGRFLTPDPARQTASPYTYAGNDPASAIDPDGEFFFLVAVVAGALLGAYAGAAAVNHDFNPAHWDWKDGRTYLGLFLGAAIGGLGGAAGVVVSEAGLAAGILGEMAIGAGENAAFTAMGGGDAKEILESAGEGALLGGLFAGGGAALGAAGRRLGRRAGGEAAEILETAGGAAEGAAGVCASFVAGTPIATPEGNRPIERIAEGDRVYSWDEDTGRTEVSVVRRTFGRETGDLLRLTVDGEEVVTTPEHPFLRQGGGWTEAASLRPGDRLVRLDRERPEETTTATVGRVERQSAGAVAVFNFEVAGNHDYYAGAAGALVHNPRCTRGMRARFLRATRGTIDTDNILEGRRARVPPPRLGSEPRFYRDANGVRRLTFGSRALRRVRIELTGKYPDDFAEADRLAGFTAARRRARNLTWHHVDFWLERGKAYGYVELVPTPLHARIRHSGGAHSYRARFGGY